MRNRLFVLLLWLVAIPWIMAAAQKSAALTAKNHIKLTKVRRDPWISKSVDVKGQRLFATAFDNHTLEVIDLKTGRQIHTIPDLDEPQGAYFEPETNRPSSSPAAPPHGTVQDF